MQNCGVSAVIVAAGVAVGSCSSSCAEQCSCLRIPSTLTLYDFTQSQVARETFINGLAKFTLLDTVTEMVCHYEYEACISAAARITFRHRSMPHDQQPLAPLIYYVIVTSDSSDIHLLCTCDHFTAATIDATAALMRSTA